MSPRTRHGEVVERPEAEKGRTHVVDIAAAPQKHLEALRLGHRVVPPGQNPVNLWGGHFFVHREDVEAVLRNPEVFSNRGGVGNDIRHPPIDYDPPEHSRYRRLLDPIFAPRQVARWESRHPSDRQRTDRPFHRPRGVRRSRRVRVSAPRDDLPATHGGPVRRP